MERLNAIALAFVSLLLAVPVSYLSAQTGTDHSAPARDANYISGTVTSQNGAEAGVWVIARTSSLPTNYVKIVVTDDRGRYLIPDLPKGNYQLWVRGYSLVDSESVSAVPGNVKNLTARIAPSPKDAAQYYPANYWLSLLQFPPASDFPGTGAGGNGIDPKVKDQASWIDTAKNGCESCHQLGDKATREISPSLGHFASSSEAWLRRISSGQVGYMMIEFLGKYGSPDRAVSMLSNWTDRIASGEFPKEAPLRPQGIERNVVITEWDWGMPTEYFHDLIASDKRNPTVNANGLIYGVMENSAGHMAFLDPGNNTTGTIEMPFEEGTPLSAPDHVLEPSPTWGTEPIWNSRTQAFSMAMDSIGRVWVTARGRRLDNPSFCRDSNLPSAAILPLDRNSRQVFVYDPKIKRFTFVNLCFKGDHIAFASDTNDTLWFSGGPNGNAMGWLDTKLFDKTHDAAISQGWTNFVLDTNANGKRDEFVGPSDAIQPSKDKRIRVATLGVYSVSVSPADGSIWGAICSACGDLNFPGSVIRLVPGTDPIHTALSERYELPWKNVKAGVQVYGARGGDVDHDGVFWEGTTSGYFASFDRRKCKGPLAGPNATGQQCPEGWAFYRFPGPTFKGTDTPSDYSYYSWVDKFNSLGLGDDVPIAIGNGSDALLALNRGNGQFVTLRVPYPMGFYAKNIDGRIDDLSAGWKGKAIWSTYATQAPQHIEGGKGTTSKVLKFQIRPDPLAK